MREFKSISHVNAAVILYSTILSPKIEDEFSDIKYTAIHSGIPCDIVDMADEQTVTDYLNDVRKRCAENYHIPLLYFECHGNEEGVEMSDGKIYPYSWLSRYFFDLNVSCWNNLWVVFGCCQAAFVHDSIIRSIFKAHDVHPNGRVRSPVHSLIAPRHEISNELVESSFRPLIKAFVSSEDDSDITQEVDKVLSLDNYQSVATIRCQRLCREFCTHFSRSLADNYLQDKDGLEAFARRRACEAPAEFRNSRTQEQLIAFFKSREYFDRAIIELQRWFYMIDIVPRNAERFPLSTDALDWHYIEQKWRTD